MLGQALSYLPSHFLDPARRTPSWSQVLAQSLDYFLAESRAWSAGCYIPKCAPPPPSLRNSSPPSN